MKVIEYYLDNQDRLDSENLSNCYSISEGEALSLIYSNPTFIEIYRFSLIVSLMVEVSSK